jgi:hypothetical protein
MSDGLPTALRDRDTPYGRWGSFHVYSNADRTFHVLVVDENGGCVFADQFQTASQAEWACGLFNAAIGYRKRD